MILTFQHLLPFAIVFSVLTSCVAQNSSTETVPSAQAYTFQKGEPNGTGKWYMGREIAYVMGFQGIGWLERTEREKEEQSELLIQNMQIEVNDTIADIGAGSGYHVFKMAPKASKGLVYAVDIQDEMLQAIANKQEEENIQNVYRIKGAEQTVNLPSNSIDKVLMVDVYHEFSFPKEILASIHQALKADGRVYLIEYRKEDKTVPIKTIHKMTEQQAVKEFEANGFELLENIENLPWQHCMVFRKVG